MENNYRCGRVHELNWSTVIPKHILMILKHFIYYFHIPDCACICRVIWPRRKSTRLYGEWTSDATERLLHNRRACEKRLDVINQMFLYSYAGGCSETASSLSRRILWALLALTWQLMPLGLLPCHTWRYKLDLFYLHLFKIELIFWRGVWEVGYTYE